MSIRIDCDVDGYEKCWVEFRDEHWPFGDRRKAVNCQDDTEILEIVVGYIDGWSLTDFEGKKLPFDKEKGLENFDRLEDGTIIGWIMGAWFQARTQKKEVPKNS